MKTLFARAALCAALALCAGPAAAGGELGSQAEPPVRGRESKVRVYLPTAEARLYVEGTLTPGSGREREFRSPGLDQGKRYAYKLLAVYVEDGREVAHEMWVYFWGGDDVRVSFRR